jgi:hypothetical protein
MERFNGGGWIDSPMGHGPENGRGVWAQPPAPDSGTEHGTPPGPGNPNFLDLVTGWGKTYLLPRQR